MPIYVSRPEDLRPLTDEEWERTFAAIERGRALSQEIKARLGVDELPDSTETIREMREEEPEWLTETLARVAPPADQRLA